MTLVTLQLLEGLERGRVYADLVPPITIGREDENTIRLNDERVSRFHAKIQEDGGKLILTDLDSTNGTRVNGHPVQIRILQIGDQLSIGRCLIVFGSREEIARRARDRRGRRDVPHVSNSDQTVRAHRDESSDFDSLDELFDASDASDPSSSALARPVLPAASVEAEDELLFPDGPPDPPQLTRPHQRAEVSEMVAYVHEQLRVILQSARQDGRPADGDMRLDWAAWQRLLNLEMDLAVYLRKLSDPDV